MRVERGEIEGFQKSGVESGRGFPLSVKKRDASGIEGEGRIESLRLRSVKLGLGLGKIRAREGIWRSGD